MSTRRMTAGVGELNGFLYAVGGWNTASQQILSTVERYDIDNDLWTPIPEMLTRRAGVAVVALEGKLYAVGGYGGYDRGTLKSVEVFNPETNRWSKVADMLCPRSCAGVVADNGYLYVVGGRRDKYHINSAEYYDPRTDKWDWLPGKMKMALDNSAVAIIDKPS